MIPANEIPANEIPKSDIIWKYSDPRKSQRLAYKYFDSVIYRSTRYMHPIKGKGIGFISGRFLMRILQSIRV